MACRGTHYSWTFSGLIGAFLDLSIACLLLCASTLAFLASKFLGFFGHLLPCPFSGLFGNRSGNYCLRRLLVDFLIERVYSVALCAKNKRSFAKYETSLEEIKSELEKERSAANSAIEETLAAIRRLEKEKASIELVARQYKREMEARSAYDAEEMNILRETIVRIEREKHFLEGRIESCRRMIFRMESGNQPLQD